MDFAVDAFDPFFSAFFAAFLSAFFVRRFGWRFVAGFFPDASFAADFLSAFLSAFFSAFLAGALESADVLLCELASAGVARGLGGSFYRRGGSQQCGKAGHRGREQAFACQIEALAFRIGW